MSFDFEETRLKEEISKRAPKTVLLQLPEGLKPQAPFLSKNYRRRWRITYCFI